MKILLIHATAGAGHQKAAEALFASLKEKGGNDVYLIDILDYTNPLFKKMYKDSYSFMVTKVPQFWGLMFGTLDLPWMYPVMSFGRRIYNYLNTGKLRKFLIKEDFDYIVTTHFMSNEVVSALKKSERINAHLISVVTDFDVHRIWLGTGVDDYCVASDWTKKKLMSLGVPETMIHVTGIPTNEKFSAEKNIPALKEKLQLNPDMFTVLIATGSFGIGPIEEIMEALEGFQVLVVCGHNKKLHETLSSKATPTRKIYGLVNNMHELMAVSNAMVTKPGGLSICEALVSHLPMIFFNAIPGQETNNVKVLKEHGVGISDCTVPQIVEKLNEYKNSTMHYLSAVEKTKYLAKPQAVQSILKLIHD